MKLTASPRTRLILATMAFIILVVSIVRLWSNNGLLGLVILIQNLLALSYWKRRRHVFRFVATALIGTIAEVAFVASGAWSYANPTLMGIPLWFPLSFGQAGLLGQEIVDILAG